MSGGERLLQAIILLLMTIGVVATDLGQGALLVSLFRMMRITIISIEVRVHLAEVWATGRALDQISKSLFTCRIEGGKLPWKFA